MIDIHHFSKNLDTLTNQIRKLTRISEQNKLLLLKFSADCQKDWDWITKDDVRDILEKIDTDPNKGEGLKMMFGSW